VPPSRTASPPRHAYGRPLVRIDTVVRRRLIDRLEAGRALGVVNVSAAAGWGKSTLLASWLDGIGPEVSVAWLTIHPSHNDPSVLADHLSRALAAADPRLSGLSGQGSLVEILSAPFDHGTHPSVLVLDDVHLLHESSALQALATAAEQVPDGACLVLSGRSDLPLPWGVLRARRRLVEIREKDLAFDHS
jgi:ATP/maltotriose-dependent transcriptional regulator MalT